MVLGLSDLSDHSYAKDAKREIFQVSCKATIKFNKCSQKEGFVDRLIHGTVNLLAKKVQLNGMVKHICNLQQIFHSYTIQYTLNTVNFKGQALPSFSCRPYSSSLLK